MTRNDYSEEMYQAWKIRDWMKWLEANLMFPFTVKRFVDDDGFHFPNIAKHEPFRLGRTMKALNLIYEDDLYGVIVKVREGRRVGSVPLCDLTVLPQDDGNFRFVEEYTVWFANR
jgi:hypothetical protein